MRAEDSQHQSRRKVALILFFWFGTIGALGFTLYDVIAGNLSWASPVRGLGSGFVFALISVVVTKGIKVPPTGTDPELEEMMARVGIRNPVVTIDASDDPRPDLAGCGLFIPERVRETWSPQALRWWISVEAKAQLPRASTSYLSPAMVVLGIILLALGERWHLNLLFGGGAVLIFIAVFGVDQWDRPHVLAIDREVTMTEEDRLAAKEALSNVYFAQVARPLSKRFMLSASFLKRRADALGITLERGFHAPRAD